MTLRMVIKGLGIKVGRYVSGLYLPESVIAKATSGAAHLTLRGARIMPREEAANR